MTIERNWFRRTKDGAAQIKIRPDFREAFAGEDSAPGGPVIRIVLVEDQEMVRDALAAFLRTIPGMEVAGAAASVRDALTLYRRHAPDIVLADLSLGDGSAIEIVKALKHDQREARVIVMTGFSDAYPAVEALSAGAGGYVLKSQASTEIVQAIHAVAQGQTYVAAEIRPKLPPRLTGGSHVGLKPRNGLGALTRRERQVFLRIIEGACRRRSRNASASVRRPSQPTGRGSSVSWRSRPRRSCYASRSRTMSSSRRRQRTV